MDSESNVNLPRLQRKKRSNIKPAGVCLLLIFFLLCAMLGFMAARWLYDPLVPTDKKSDDTQATHASDDILNVLILGVDQRENEPARADTIILAFLNLTKKEATLLSIPRDTRVKIAQEGTMRKINYAHAVGGVDMTIATVENFLDVPVHYYVETNFSGFENVIDILGGVTLNVEERMYFPEEGIDLYAGLQVLEGHDALSYVRWRGDGKGDIGRIARQQKFAGALLDQAISLSTVWKVPELLAEMDEHLKTNMSLQKMIALANKFKNLEEVKFETHMVPGAPDDVNYGASYWIADDNALKELLEEIHQEENKQEA